MPFDTLRFLELKKESVIPEYIFRNDRVLNDPGAPCKRQVI